MRRGGFSVSDIKAIVFDMDGVLIDAKDWHFEALNRALKIFGLEISRYDHLVTYDGLPTKKKLEMLSLENNLPRGLHDFINDMKQQFTTELIHSSCRPVFRHQYALSRLKKEGYHLAVASNSIRQTVELMLSKAEVLPYIDFFISNQDVQKSKPDPEMYTVAIKRLAIHPKECLVVEDNENGIKAALASGARLLRVRGVEDVTYENIMRKVRETGETK